ncbi:sn-glycerol-3-phosphate ABC transporter ATP-binding protein UgpC [Telmatospirillum sp.]|uniref:ABC transporter ATP-binding protein n=1 Tax=Telmatospirillum sp. TaxID=2079197 RepID=UPI00283B9DC1|nr:sn-glycerol-3-phosphate ABC transporter ATP-binding protein UgpC [Telmatospirillum sp.]MDR3440128.1 sn-glycerol-3-phosphate ABC transporter ATP-binding protein UgpC [Telmatospirillum sp.]
MSGVEITNVSKSFGSLETIHGISFSIEDGSFVALIGPSGCGKSTMLRMISGLETISDGTISIGNKLANALPPKDRDVAMVFQNYAIYPHMTVAENIGFPLRLRNLARAEIDKAVTETAAILNLEPLLKRYPKALSGGQRQRVAMGRAIIRRPSVFLFDEPLSNLDANLRVQMRAEIKKLHQTLGTTMIYVTHDQIEAMTMADKVVVLRDGRVEQSGPPLDLYDRPANRFVASFIGSPAMNFLDAEAVDGEIRLKGGQSLRLRFAATHPEGKLVFGIRPENIGLSGDGLPVRVDLVEPTGAETHLELDLAGHSLVAVVRERVMTSPGDVLHVTFDPRAIHLFDPETGEAKPAEVIAV